MRGLQEIYDQVYKDTCVDNIDMSIELPRLCNICTDPIMNDSIINPSTTQTVNTTSLEDGLQENESRDIHHFYLGAVYGSWVYYLAYGKLFLTLEDRTICYGSYTYSNQKRKIRQLKRHARRLYVQFKKRGMTC
jgi:hypothetical protein